MSKMRVYELAREFDISSEMAIHLLREMEIPVSSHMSSLDDAQVARARARLEREKRRPGKMSIDGDSGRRRRRRRRVEKPEPTAEAGVETVGVEEEPAEVGEAEEAEVVEEIVAEVEAAEPAEVEVEEEEDGEEEEVVEAPAAEAEEVEPEAEEVVEEEEEEEEEEVVEAELEVEEEVEAEEEELEEEEDDETASEPTPARRMPVGGQVRIQAEGYTVDGRRERRSRRKKKRTRVDREAVEENIKRTLAKMEGATPSRRRRRDTASAEEREREEQEARRREEEEQKTVRVPEFLTVAELADLVDVPANQIITSAFKNLGLMVTINQRLDFDQIELICEELGFQAAREEEYAADLVEAVEKTEPEELVPRPPVVTVMGHVDHGKTSLLDYIRKTNVIAGESGGITQHIGAYHVELDDGRKITFLDTPGHAAFTAMRARGADVTDLVILVVAADDGVMPQTEEAISHARNAGKPVLVAVNKIDLPGATPDRVKQELLEHEIVIEEYGGEVLCSEISAKTGAGIDDLLEKVLLQAELLELKSDPEAPARGTVIEAELDKGMGSVATVLVTSGTLEVGDPFVCGLYAGRVRAMLDERGNDVETAGPGIPVRVLGFEGVPQAGDGFAAVEYEQARSISGKRQQIEREKEMRRKARVSRLEDVFDRVEEGAQGKLNLIIKGDTDGSVQALSDELEALSTREVEVEVIHRGVGAVNESDVLLAQTSDAIIIGFHVRPDAKAREVAESEGVDIRTYRVIYEAVEEVRAALEGMLAPEEKEIVLGTAEVRKLFRVPRVGTVAGCYVTDGVIDRNSQIRVLREHVVVYEGKVGSLKRFQDDVKEVKSGYECGLSIENFNDVKVGDILESFRIEEVARTLEQSGAAEAGVGGETTRK